METNLNQKTPDIGELYQLAGAVPLILLDATVSDAYGKPRKLSDRIEALDKAAVKNDETRRDIQRLRAHLIAESVANDPAAVDYQSIKDNEQL